MGVSAPWALSCRELSGGGLALPPANVRSSMTPRHGEVVQERKGAGAWPGLRTRSQLDRMFTCASQSPAARRLRRNKGRHALQSISCPSVEVGEGSTQMTCCQPGISDSPQAACSVRTYPGLCPLRQTAAAGIPGCQQAMEYCAGCPQASSPWESPQSPHPHAH